jgi:hypothetical protein
VPVIDADETFDIVRKDLVAGLSEAFSPEPDKEPFVVAEPFRGEQTIDNERVYAVPWSFRCVHTGNFQGLFRTGRRLEIEGVTLVDRREGVMLHRYVDWAGVIAQLGLTVSWRVPVTEAEYADGRSAPES